VLYIERTSIKSSFSDENAEKLKQQIAKATDFNKLVQDNKFITELKNL